MEVLKLITWVQIFRGWGSNKYSKGTTILNGMRILLKILLLLIGYNIKVLSHEGTVKCDFNTSIMQPIGIL